VIGVVENKETQLHLFCSGTRCSSTMVEWNDGARMQECNGMMVPRHRVQQNDDAMMWWYSSATMQRAIVTVFSGEQ